MTGVLVAPPARAPVGFGLFSQVTFRPGLRWEAGVDWESLACSPAQGIGEPQCPPVMPPSVAFGTTGDTNLYKWRTVSHNIEIAASGPPPDYAQLTPQDLGLMPGAAVVFEKQDGTRVPVTLNATFTAGQSPGWTVVAPAGALDANGGFDDPVTVWLADSVPDPAVTVGLPKTLDVGANGGHASAFTVYGAWSCSPVGYTPAQAQDRATEHLLTYEEARVEQALWTGDLDNTPTLKGAADLLPAGTSLPIVQGLAVLEDHLAAHYGSVGLIHLTRGAALQAIAADVVHQSGGRLVTALGTPVVAGSGYPGTGPAGEPAGGGFSWAYATGSLFAYRGDVFTSSSRPGDLFDHAQNTLHAVAERQYLLGFDPCGVAAVRLNLAT